MLPAGKLNRKLTIQQRASGADSYGQPSTTWQTFASNVYAWAKAPTGSASAEGVSADRDTSTVVMSFRVRYRTDITAAMRAVCDGVTYEIRQVVPDVAGRQYTDLVCESVP